MVIPCRNEKAFIGKCLDSLVAVDYPKDLLEVYVCDGMSDDGTRDIVNQLSAQHPFIQLLDNEARFTPQALNLGLKTSQADVRIILGAHAEVDVDFIKENLAALAIDPQIGCAGGIIENVYLNSVAEIIGYAMSSPFGVGNAHFRTGGKDGYVDTVAFGAYRKEVFEKAGFFDERLVRNQDDEFNYRLLQNDFKIWLSKKVVSKYFVRGSYQKLFRQYYQYGYWKVFVNTIHGSVTTIRQLIPFFFVLFLLSGPICGLIHPILGGLWSLGLVAYFGLALVFALRKAPGFISAIKVMFTFFILHFSYGWGYLHGVFDFILRGKKPAVRQTASSR